MTSCFTRLDLTKQLIILLVSMLSSYQTVGLPFFYCFGISLTQQLTNWADTGRYKHSSPSIKELHLIEF